MPSDLFDAIIFLGPEGPGPIEQTVLGARRAAAEDLAAELLARPDVRQVIVATSEREWAEDSGLDVTWDFDTGEHFHFGRRLAGLIEQRGLRRIMCFGAGSAPLLPKFILDEAASRLQEAQGSLAVTNNLNSSDWILLSDAFRLIGLADRLPNDNALGWVLEREAGFRVHALPASAATRIDIDTPADFPALVFHPGIKPRLKEYLRAVDPETRRYREAARRAFTPGRQIALIGRVSSSAWAALESKTQVWIRVYSEERGMSASGRLAAGQVRSFVADHIIRVGVEKFFEEMERIADAIFMDNRVILAHGREWPSAPDRYASDAGRPDLVSDEFLRRITVAGLNAKIPVVMGGHGVVNGGLFALAETGLLPDG